MGIAGDLARHGAQAEALAGGIAGSAQPAIVENQAFGMGALDENLAIIGAVCGLAQDGKRRLAVELGIEGAEGLLGHARSGLCNSFKTMLGYLLTVVTCRKAGFMVVNGKSMTRKGDRRAAHQRGRRSP